MTGESTKIDDDRTNPIGLFNYATSFWRSAKKLDDDKLKVTHPDAPICTLYYHSIELYLKAFLRAKNYTVGDLQYKFGHNAVKLRDVAREHGLHLDDEDRAVLEFMTDTDAVIEARYIRTGFFQRPANDALDRTCNSLHQSVGEALRLLGHLVRL